MNNHDLFGLKNKPLKYRLKLIFLCTEWERKDRVQGMILKYLSSEEGKVWSLRNKLTSI